MSHSWIHFLHLVFALLLAGGLITGSVVRAGVKRSDDLNSQVFGFKLMARAFNLFTLPGLMVAGFLGFYLMGALGFRFALTWIQLSTWIYLVMLGVAWIVVFPVLRRGSAEAERSLKEGQISPTFQKIMDAKLWGILHDCISLGMVALVLLMVIKP